MNKKINEENKQNKQQNVEQQQCTTNRDLIPVYTEWANHHLLKAKLPPLTDLTGELCLPHKLIPLIYSIIVEFNNISLEQLMNKMEAKEPVTTIEKCLDFCKQIGVHSEDIKPRDIRNGHLGAILQLLHQLSEYKRQKRKIIEDKNIHQRRVHFNNLQQQSPKHLSNPSYCSHNSFSKTSSSHIYEQCSSSSGYGSVCHTNISGGSTVSNKNIKEISSTTDKSLNKKLKLSNNYIEEEEPKKRSKQKYRVAFKMPPNLINSRSNKEETNNNNLNKNINNEEKRFASIASTPQSSSSLRIPQKISINRQNNQQIKTAEIINSSEQQQQFLQNSENQRIYQKLNQNNLNKPIESKISLTSNIAIKYKNYSTNTQQNCPLPPSFPPPSIQYSSSKTSPQTSNFNKLEPNTSNKLTQLKIPNNLKSDKNIKETTENFVLIVNDQKSQQFNNINSSFNSNKSHLNQKEELFSKINTNNSSIQNSSPINSKIQNKSQELQKTFNTSIIQQKQQKPPPLPQKPLLNLSPSSSISSHGVPILCTKSALRMPSKHLIGRNIKNNIVNNEKQENEEEKKELNKEKSTCEQLQINKTTEINYCDNIQSNPKNTSETEQDNEIINEENITKIIEEEKLNSKNLEKIVDDIQIIMAKGSESLEQNQENLKSSQESSESQQQQLNKEDSEMPPQTKKEDQTNNKQNLSKQNNLLGSSNKRSSINTLLITPSSTRKYSSQQKPSFSINKSKLNNSISPPSQMSSSNTSTVLSTPDCAELNISQCSNISTENNKTKQRKQCFSMPTSATQSMVASTSATSASLRSSLLSGNDRPKSLLPLQSSKLIRPSNIGRTTNKNIKQNGKQEVNILTNSGGKPSMSKISTKSATNSPQNNNTEKKPVLAVKGVSVLSTTPATQKRRPSSSNCSNGVLSTDCNNTNNSATDPSLVEQQKRNRENVAVGVVSPMLQKHENNFILNNQNLDDVAVDNTMGIVLVEKKEENKLKEKDQINQNVISLTTSNEDKNNKQKASCSTNQEELKSSLKNNSNLLTNEKKILIKKPSNLNKILLPVTSTKIGKIKIKENLTKTTKLLPKGNEKIIREEEECPQSPLMPPPLAPTKLCNNGQSLLRGELQALPCISSSSSSSSPNEEEVQQKQQQQIQHFRLAITAASNDSTTSQDSLDSVRTAIHCPKQTNNSSQEQQMSQKIKQIETTSGSENSEILLPKRRENEKIKDESCSNQQIGFTNKNKELIERLSEPRRISSDTINNISTRHSSTTISSMLKSDGNKNYRYTTRDDCINFYAASSCSSLSSALSEPLDDDQFSTSDLTTASSSGGQNSPEKHPNMDFIGFRAPHPPQRQQQFLQPPKMRTIQNRGSPSNLMGPLGMPVSNKYIQQNKIIHPQQWQQPNNNNRYSVATTSDITRPSTSCSGNNVHFSSSDGGHILLRNSLNNSGAQWTDPKESTNVHFYAQPGGAFEEYSPPSSTSQSSSYFRAYHTFTSANFQQIQQQRNQQRRILSPPHHLMALSDDGDTLSVAAGEIGGQQQQQMLSSAFGRRPMNGQQTGENNDSSIRHPAYHTHSLDRHAHLRIFQQPRIPPMQNGGIPTRNGNIKLSTQTKQQNNQFNSLLISPRHFAYPSSTFASTPNNQMMQQDKKMGSNNAHIQQNNNLIQRINSNNFNQNYRPQSSARSCAIFEEENISNKRSASLSAMSRSMVTVINGNNTKQLNEQQQINEKNNSENRESRVIEYIQQLINLQNKRNKSFKQQQIPLPPPRRTAISPNFLNRVPLSLPRNDGSRIYSNLPNNVQQQKFSSANNSCLNSPNKIQLISSDEIIQQQPGSQLSLISSLGSTYTNNIEERYEWEVNKLQSELESYRTTVSLLNQRHSGYNCMLQIFDTKLQTIMLSLSKLQQKRHVKRNEVERLCREIEHLRSLSISAGVVPKEQQQLNIKKENNNSLPPSNDKEIIEKEKNIKIINEKSSSVGRGEQTEGGGKKAGWIRSSFTRAFQKGSSKKNKQTQQQTNEEEKQKINEENIDGKKNEQQPFYVKSLKKELENKELALTDVQLDALDKAKEIDILRETVNKLQHENRMLKYNFSLLERRVRSESRASSHISLNTNLCSGGPPDCSGGDLDVDALEEAANQLLEVPEHSNLPLYDIVASSPSSGDFSVNTTTTGSSLEARSNKSQRTSIGSNISKTNQQQFIKVVLCVDMSGRLNIESTTNNSSTLPPSSSCSLASISRASSGSSSTLSSLGSALSGCGNKRRELSIGHLSLPLAEGINWRDLDQQLGLLLEEYLHRIDPDLSLGVDSYSSIIGYQIIPKNSLGIPNEWLIRRRNSIDDYLNIKNNQNNEMEELNPKLSPEEVLQPGTLIRLRLRGVSQHSVDSLVLESLFPRNLLEQLLDQLEKYRRLILFGTAGIGKSNLARLIAKYYLMKFNIELNNKSLIEIHFPTENNNLMENETKIQQAKEQLFNALNSQNNLFSTFILLDNLPLKYLNGIVFDVFQSFDLKNKSSKNKLIPFVICTLNRTNLAEQLIIQKLQIYHNFHLCPLNQKMEAVNGYLGRYLRRRMAEQTLSSISTSLPSSSLSLNSLDSLIDFLNRSLYLINEFIERTANGGSNVTLGPRILLQCPLEGDQAKEWFIRLWNDKLVPYLRKAVIEGNNPKSDLIDLTEQIRSIWLWQNFSEELKRIEIK